MTHWDYIVVGGGVMGSATAYQLARRGERVLLLEQFAIGHMRGSSHGHSRIIRYSYETPGYVQLMRAAYQAWADAEQDASTQLVHVVGGLDVGDPETPSLQACYASLRANGIACEWLDQRALAERFPQFLLSESMVGLYQADAGILPASQCVATLLVQARRYGADVRENVAVQQIKADGDGVAVQTTQETYLADRIVITAGSWAQALLRDLGLDLPLKVTREQVVFFAPRRPELFAPDRFPIFISYGATEREGSVFNFYGFPIFGLAGIKVAQHHAGLVIQPDDDNTAPEPAATRRVQAYVEQMLPDAAGEVLHAETCRYTSTPDMDFILDCHPVYPQIIVGSPCSGHGFKFGALVGHILADLAQGGMTKHAIAPFTLRRFGV
ncbi:MAG: N-methyl-L-tryptophan oxidase [Chloroflexales bacterium]|nr:N-methyl-L-tryptophan oxidase [Chloroflexales bacterium]